MNNLLLIKPATISDVDSIRFLFLNTITNINIIDYSEEQIKAWSSGYTDIKGWQKKIKEQNFFLAELKNIIVGFASITNDGCVDYLYIHKDYQHQGIATKLLQELEKSGNRLRLQEIWADVSLTAKPFFLNRGFIISNIYSKKTKGVEFINTIMTKRIGV